MKRFRVIHKNSGDYGYICQESCLFGWRDVGIRYLHYHFSDSNSHWTGSKDDAIRRLDWEVEAYKAERDYLRQKREHKITVVKEWP